MVGAAKIAFTMGAIEIEMGSAAFERWVRPSTLSHAGSYAGDRSANKQEEREKGAEQEEEDETSFNAWLSHLTSPSIAVASAEQSFAGSAHQMGTCRMSSSPATGVVDDKGLVWGTKGVYVADASTFPSASGVNPMVTVMGIAEWICRGIEQEERRKREGGGKVKVSKL
jgi:choline dehydrogenase-like flavoprotein